MPISTTINHTEARAFRTPEEPNGVICQRNGDWKGLNGGGAARSQREGRRRLTSRLLSIN